VLPFSSCPIEAGFPLLLGGRKARLTRLGWVGLGWVGLGWVGLGWVGLGWVGLGWVGLLNHATVVAR
jgi:hypothetical protein